MVNAEDIFMSILNELQEHVWDAMICRDQCYDNFLQWQQLIL